MSSHFHLIRFKVNCHLTFRIVSSEALPNRFRCGRGDSGPPPDAFPLPIPPDPGDEEFPPPAAFPNLCGSVFDFSHGLRDELRSSESGCERFK